METSAQTAAVEHVEHKPDLLNPDLVMLILTWVTFFALLAILKKFAWKPIIDALEKRENTIRASLEQADKIQSELTDIQASKEKVISDAHKSAQEIIDQARKRAQDLAQSIEEHAKTEAQQLVSSAHQEIEGEKERVKAALRRDSADIAVLLAGKIMKENLDNEKNRKLVDQYIKEI